MRLNGVLFVLACCFTLTILIQATNLRAEGPSVKEVQVQLFEDHIEKLYHEIKYIPGKEKPSYQMFRQGIIGYLNLNSKRKLSNKPYLTLIDFSLSSTKERFWLIDLEQKEVLVQTYCAHGRNTGYEYARNFSNTYDTYQSSIGFYVTGSTYYGRNGLSLTLDGMEKGFNSNARGRVIVFHSAKYVSEAYIRKHGRLGRSLGCPAIPMKYREKVINKIADKTTFFIYYPDQEYLAKSKLIDAESAALGEFLAGRALTSR